MNFDNFEYILIGIFLFLIYFLIRNGVKQCPGNKIMIIFGVKNRHLPYKIVESKTTFIIPFLHIVKYFDLSVFTKEFRFNAKDENNTKFSLDVKFEYSISTEPVILDNAVKRMIDLPVERIEKLGEQIILVGAKKILEDRPVKKNDHIKLERDLSDSIMFDLEKQGFRLNSIKIDFYE